MSSTSLCSNASILQPLRYCPTAPYSVLEAYQEITLLAHRIAEKGGTTSAIARLPRRIQQTNTSISDKKMIEELQRDLDAQREENDHLRRVNYDFNRFRERAVVAFQGFRNALHELSTSVALSAEELSKYWGFELDDTRDDGISVI